MWPFLFLPLSTKRRNVASLTIYKASAGSGKTYTITGEYIRLLFENADNYRHILGVTFTNKATAEMKSRIIAELFKLSTGASSGYVSDLGISADQVKQKASYILYRILHDYSHFTISTIDSFFQRVIRTFAREVGFFQGFEVELDQRKILSASIDELIFQLDKRPELRHWLIRFAEEKILDGQSWDINKDIETLGNELFKENYKEFAEQIYEKISDKAFMERFNRKLSAEYKEIEDKIRLVASEALTVIQTHNLLTNDFKGSSRGIGHFFESTFKKADFEDWKLSDTIRNHVDNPEAWYTRKSDKQSEIESAYSAGLNKLLVQLVELFESDYVRLKSISAVQKHFYVLAMIGDLQAQIRQYVTERNLFLISDTAELLNKLIRGSDAPFVYERTGSYINHFMIDEFQDTSMLQWRNFKPLVINSMAEGNANWVVGDVKQSIYRWRNSDWTILSEKIFDDVAPHPTEVKSLKYNWRSCSNIVSFNNSFFRNALEMVAMSNAENDTEGNGVDEFTRVLSNAYADFAQLVPDARKNEDGWVRFEFVEIENRRSNEWKEVVLEKLPAVVERMQDNGYNLSDIAILVRDKKDARLIADYFLEYQKKSDGRYRYDILSGDSLLLKNAEIVKWLVACFKYIIDASDAENSAFLVYQYNLYIINTTTPIEGMFRPGKDNFYINPELLEYFNNSSLRNRSVYELTDEIVCQFRLNELKTEIPFLQAFQDMLHDYVKREPVDIHSFLNWWEEQSENKVITMPSDQDAMRLMTLHTSKGLEFPVVLMPFGNWEIMKSGRSQQILWCKPNNPLFEELDLLPVNMSQSLTSTFFKDDYLHEKGLLYVDNLNLLYVAFTRAIDALVVFSPDFEEEGLKNDIASLIQNSMATQNFDIQNANYPAITLPQYYSKELKVFEFGTLRPVKRAIRSKQGIQLNDIDYTVRDVSEVSRQVIPSYEYLGDGEGFVESRLNRGKLMHELLQYIKTADDIDAAITRLTLEGKLAGSDRETIKSMLVNALNQDQAKDWFSAKFDLRMEASILLPGGQMYRPDRVMINGKQAVVLDYKFGEEESPAHIKQVSMYMRFIRNMGYTNTSGWVWYVLHHKFVPVGEKPEQLSMF